MNAKAKIRQVNEKENQRCFNCHSLGHFSTECPEPQMTLCYNCHEQGHKTFECHRTLSCRNCAQVGHKERQCRVKKAAVNVSGLEANKYRWAAEPDATAAAAYVEAGSLFAGGRAKETPAPPPPPPGIPSLTQQWTIDSTTSAPETASPTPPRRRPGSANSTPRTTTETPSPALDDSAILQGLLSAYLSVASTPTHAPASSPSAFGASPSPYGGASPSPYGGASLRQQVSADLNSAEDSSEYLHTPHPERGNGVGLPRYARSETGDHLQRMLWRSSSSHAASPPSRDSAEALFGPSRFALNDPSSNRRVRLRGATETRPSAPVSLLSEPPSLRSSRRDSRSPSCLATPNLATLGSRSTMAATPRDAVSRSSLRHSARHISWNQSTVNPGGNKSEAASCFSLSQLEAARLASSLPALPSSSRGTFECFASDGDWDLDPTPSPPSRQTNRQSSFCLDLGGVRTPPSPCGPVAPFRSADSAPPVVMTIVLGQDPCLIAYSEPVFDRGFGHVPNDQASKYVAPCSVVGRPLWLLNAAALFKSDLVDPWRPWPEYAPLMPAARRSPLRGDAVSDLELPGSARSAPWLDYGAPQPPVVAVQAPRDEESPNLTGDLCGGADLGDVPPKPNTRLRLPASPSSFSVASAPTSNRYHGSLSPAMRPSATSWLTATSHLQL
eukprot:Gregarina_sp_Pseudo_9__5815@NODE_883_length_2100_cov_7_769529_g829_i0_p1_GENE_NODE_883_length_2100_cov_7_769529_g829_i0NODE_883_length_2100_cov_7_769529_g829_i0_p1_ORF_typecomplete_len670_score204_32zfCCHC/PF00098_23/0_00018zfCCHC/PF00098_23/14zfCCHC/PF00098_23/0_059zfCCHC_3/PF13917_6/0_2zfCCHC_3/PF13917_6/0_039zfCCHC_3/PF13917_6/0_2zfCCHC_3/PF13917_6/3_2e03zfCCHC_4/PF14392_6/0_12zfCCHC_4/PF14392_6/16zfCCHC_4/PF14392_6/0_7Paired_CXXCH_1/PF09699_10/6_7Paired_CXXCH_1/PF09699_10/1_7DUF2744/PF10910_